MIHRFTNHEDPQYIVYPVLSYNRRCFPHRVDLSFWCNCLPLQKWRVIFNVLVKYENHNETTTKSQWIKRLHVCQNWIYNTKTLSPRILAAQMYLHKAVVDLRTKTLEGIFMTQFTLLLCYLTSLFCEQSICCKYSENLGNSMSMRCFNPGSWRVSVLWGLMSGILSVLWWIYGILWC